MPLPCAGTYCHCQQTPSHQCIREFLSLAVCVKYKVIPSIQSQGQGLGLHGQGLDASRPRPRTRILALRIKAKANNCNKVLFHNTRPARPRPIFLSETGLVARPTVSDHMHFGFGKHVS